MYIVYVYLYMYFTRMKMVQRTIDNVKAYCVVESEDTEL